MNIAHEASDTLVNPALESPSSLLFNSITASDWQNLSGKTPIKGESLPSDSQLSFDNIYAKSTTLGDNNLKASAAAGDSQPTTSKAETHASDSPPTASKAQTPSTDSQPAASKAETHASDSQPAASKVETPSSDSQPTASKAETPSTDSQPAASKAETPSTDTQPSASGSDALSTSLKQLDSAISGLKTDEQALAKAPDNKADLSKVNADETTLHTDEMNYMKTAAANSTYADYSQTMAGQHSELKNIANGLWNMGQKTDASETTAYYPTSHYEKYFQGSTGTGPGNPGDPGSPTLKDETSETNLQSDSWKTNLIKSEIGGKGINPNMQLTSSDGALTATMSGGAYTDGLISNTQKYNPNDNTVQLNYNLDIKPGSDLHALEMDEAITGNKQADGKVLTAMAASQFVMDPKTGTMEFDTSGTNHEWEDGVNGIPIPKDGKMDVSMTVKMVGDTYEYTGLTVNGKTYAINPDESTFQMTQIGKKGWTPDTVHVQMQQDLGADGGSSTVTYNDVQVNQGNT